MTEIPSTNQCVTKAQLPLYTILEIGVGRVDDVTERYSSAPEPDFRTWSSTADYRTFAPHEQFIGIDLGARTRSRLSHQEVRRLDRKMLENWRAVQAARPGERLHFLKADATELPLASDSVDEVVINNLFGGGALPDTLAGIYRQAQRVLKETGKLIIHDDYTPRYIGRTSLLPWFYEYLLPVPAMNWINAGVSPELYAELAQHYGFNVNKYASLADDESSRERNARRTLWILGKAAAVQPKPVQSNEQLPDADPPDTTSKLFKLKALLHKIFPPEE